MAIPGFTAHTALQRPPRFYSRRIVMRSGGVLPAMMIEVNGAAFCEGTVSGNRVTCSNEYLGEGPAGKGISGCVRSCRSACSKNPHAYPTPCYRSCVAQC